MIPSVSINLIAVVAATIVSMVIGMVWYSPAVFGNQWMKLVGMEKKKVKEADMKKEMMKGMPMQVAATLVMTYFLAVFVAYAQAKNIVDGAIVGIMVWVGFVGTTASGDYLWGGKPKQLFWINNGLHLVTLAVSGAILATM